MEDQNVNLSANSKDQSGDFATKVIPQSQRKSGLNLFNTTAGWIICLSTMFTGGALVAGMSFSHAMICAVIGMAILTLYSAPLAGIGSKLGVSTAMITRHTFGRYGSVAFAAMNALLMGIGWFAFQAAFFGLTLSELLPGSMFSNPILGSVISAALMTLTAMYGYKGISILSFIAVPLIIVLSVFGSIAGVESSGGWANLLSQNTSDNSISLYQGITMVVGNAAMGAITLSDITRFGKKPSAGALSAAFGYMVGGIFCILAGASMMVGAKVESVGTTPNLPAIMLAIGLGFGALMILILAQWTTNTANIYSGALGMASIVKIKQSWIVLIMGIIATLIAAFNVYGAFNSYLNILGIILPPVAGVILSDYYVITSLLRKKQYCFGEGTQYCKLNVLAIAVVALAGWLSTIPPFNRIFAASFVGIVLAFLLYSIVAGLLEKLHVQYKLGISTETSSGF